MPDNPTAREALDQIKALLARKIAIRDQVEATIREGEEILGTLDAEVLAMRIMIHAVEDYYAEELGL